MIVRNVVRIDEEKCAGCGLCVPSCAERALRIVDGKAKLISDKYCDGLGACLGECPEGAITIIKREAEEFDEAAANRHLKTEPLTPLAYHAHSVRQSRPSAKAMRLPKDLTEKANAEISEKGGTMLSQWPVQLTLVPSNASFFENTNLLIAADCVPFAYPDFHTGFLKGKTLVVGCPKLDDVTFYKKKLTEIFKQASIRSVTIVNMEVPCCFGLHRLVKEAMDSSGKVIPLKQEIISIKGDRLPSSMEGYTQPNHHSRDEKLG